MQTSGIRINVFFLGNNSIILEISKTTQFSEIVATTFQQHQFQKKYSNQHGLVIAKRNILIIGEDLKKQFQQYSSNNYEDIIFLVDQELNDYINNNSNILGPPQQSQNYINQTLPDLNIVIVVQRRSETYNLKLENDSITILDIFEWLQSLNAIKNTQTVAFLHQLSAGFYEFNNFQTKLSDISSFEKDRKLIYLDDELVNKFRPQVIVEKVNQQGEQSPSKLIKIPQVENGITINILSEDGPSRRNFQFVNMSPNLTVLELKQLVCQYLGYNNPEIVDVDLFKTELFQLNNSNKQNRTLYELNLVGKEITVIAKTRWIGGYDL